jgi:hypothetical protein
MFDKFSSAVARIAWFAASFAATSVLLLGLGALFGAASPPTWLRDTPQSRAVAATCAARADRAEQRDCMREAIARAQARDAGATRLAAGQPRTVR